MKKLILVLMGFVYLFLSSNLVFASNVIINEFVSDGSPEWVELLNTTDSDISLDGWLLRDAANHNKSLDSLVLIPAHGIVVFESSSGWLNNDDNGDTINLYDGTNLIDKVIYGKLGNLESPSSGKSGALISGVWQTNQDPTKGIANETEVTPPIPSDDSSSSTTTIPLEPKPKVIENPTMKVKILANALAFTGEPLEIKTNVTGFSNENVVLGKASWNFGDGSLFEQINNFEKFSHIYYYPGEYVLFLEYYSNSFSKEPEAVSKMVIKVLPTNVFISKVGDAKDFFIELTNNASSDIDISNWVINANGKTFILPKNSVIMSKKQMTISGKITGFTIGDQNNLKLYSGTGELVYDYNAGIQPPKSPLSGGLPTGISSSPDKGRSGGVVSTAVQPLENLGATVLQSDVLNSESASNFSTPFFPIASFVFIGASAGAVYFIRRKKVVSETGDDFEILDE
jgi:hypothetical protein